MNEILIQTVKNMQRHFVVWGMLAVVIMYSGMMSNQADASKGRFDRSPATGTLEDVLTKFECKDTVKGEFPTAVVLYSLKTGGHVVSINPDHIGKALDEEFAGKEWKGYDVKYFCK